MALEDRAKELGLQIFAGPGSEGLKLFLREQNKSPIVIAFFMTDWSKPCDQFYSGLIEGNFPSFLANNHIRGLHINVDDHHTLAGDEGIKAIHTAAIYIGEAQAYQKWTGLMAPREFMRAIEEKVSAYAPITIVTK